MQIGDFPIRAQGWQCPICGRVYSPSTPMCFYCQKGTPNVTTTDRPMSPGVPLIDKIKNSNDWTELFKFMNKQEVKYGADED